ncbi:hypothetical protein [Methanothrix soehngenii]|uniref:hypothetical protein n=1 Tax=Methanothrix soehngenii TaxID=2223 RepID=UPI00300D8389
MGHKIYKKMNSYQTIILSVLLVIVGILFLIPDKYYSSIEIMDLILSILHELGAILIATGIVALIWELIAKRSFFEEIMEKIELADQIRDSGGVNPSEWTKS